MERLLKTMKRRGVTAIEVVVGVSIAGIILVYAIYAITQFVNSARDVTVKTEALYLAADGIELIRFVRDSNWSTISNLNVNQTHYLSVATTSITVTNSPETVGNLTRSFVVERVYRDATSDDIVASTTAGAVQDTNARYITVTVASTNPVAQVSLSALVANLDP